MSRPWNTWIALTFVAVAAVGGLNVWNISSYEPLRPSWKTFVLSLTVLSVVAAPLLTYFAVTKSKQWMLAASFVVLIASFFTGQIVGRNGKNDTTPVEYRNATVLKREITHIKSTRIYRLTVQLQEVPQHTFTVATSHDIYEQIEVGGIVSVPIKAGSLGIPWRIKGPDIRVVQFRRQ